MSNNSHSNSNSSSSSSNNNNNNALLQPQPQLGYSLLTKEKAAVTKSILEQKYSGAKLAKSALERMYSNNNNNKSNHDTIYNDDHSLSSSPLTSPHSPTTAFSHSRSSSSTTSSTSTPCSPTASSSWSSGIMSSPASPTVSSTSAGIHGVSGGSPSSSHENSSSRMSRYRQMMAQRRNIKDFERIKVIGRGAFGEVRLVREIKTGQVMAMKMLKKSEMLKMNQIQHVRAERDLMAASSESNWLVQLHCSFQDDDYLYLVMEYLPGGDMMYHLIEKEIFSEQETRFYIAELVMAVDEIHKLEYVHRDLKPDNILLDRNGHIKLSDFGLSKPFSGALAKSSETEAIEQAASTLKVDKIDSISRKEKADQWKKKVRLEMLSVVGSNGYIAPEVLLKKGYGIECDWWSVGVIMFEMLCGYPPFYAENAMETCHQIVRFREFLSFPHDEVQISPAAEDLIRRFLCSNTERIGMNGVEEIKSHPFFEGLNWNSLRQSHAPFVPKLEDATDTSYFDEFDDDAKYATIRSSDPQQALRLRNMSKDQNHLFSGYTFNRGDSSRKNNPKPSLKNLFAEDPMQE